MGGKHRKSFYHRTIVYDYEQMKPSGNRDLGPIWSRPSRYQLTPLAGLSARRKREKLTCPSSSAFGGHSINVLNATIRYPSSKV